ncbi:MAG: hypothetical protein P4L57_05360 [Rhizomicrobium sp.]|nr:hypothetical protein [Rhizomicrobium sp.]
MLTAKQGLFGAFLASGLILGGSAAADVTGFLGGLLGVNAANAEFLGSWTARNGDIDHVVVTASGSGPVRIQVFGRCETRICNWGALPARIRTEGPNSETVLSLAADFNLGFALRHITLHKQPGKMLRFDMVTEFTDGSERHDYESSGQLSLSGTAPAPTSIPTTAPQSAPATSAAVAAPTAVASSAVAGPLTTDQPTPIDNSQPVAASSAQVTDDCFAVDTTHAYVAMDSDNWKLRDFLHVVQNFGPYRAAAGKGLAVLKYYHFDEICHVGRGASNMAFYRASGEVPHQASLPKEDCLDVHPEKVEILQRDEDWQVVEGGRAIYNYGSDRSGAAQAAGIIKSLNLSRQCFFDRANLSASYWLSR